MTSPLRIERLGRHHRALLGGFKNQEQALETYLRRFALRHQEKDLLARTFLAIDTSGDEERVAGYFSLTTVSVIRSSLAPLPSLSRLPGFPIPGVLLARLAVDERVQGQGLGRHLFEEALGLTLLLASGGPLSFRLFVTDAKTERAVSFYERLGFARLSMDLSARMVLDLAPLLRGTAETS